MSSLKDFFLSSHFLYIIKRLFLMIPTLLGITLITFLIMKLAPGDPQMLKLMFAGDQISPEALSELLKSTKPTIKLSEGYLEFTSDVSLYFNPPLKTNPELLKETESYKFFKSLGENTVFYFRWLGNIMPIGFEREIEVDGKKKVVNGFHFKWPDFGISSKDNRPVMDKIRDAIPITILINVLSIVIIYLVSIPLGIWSALNQGTKLDKVVMVNLFILYSLPGFWLATMLLVYLAGGEYLDLFPLLGYKSEFFDKLNFIQKFFDVAWHLFLPILASVIGGFAFLSRFARSNILDVIKQDYIRTARAKGLSKSKVLYKHALRNAMIPFVTLMGTLLPGLLGGSVVIEQIFTIPGMGMLSFESVLSRDHNVIMAIAAISAFLTLLSLLITDLLYVFVDPRISLE